MMPMKGSEPVGSLKPQKHYKTALNSMDAGEGNYSDPSFLFSNFLYSFFRFFFSSFLFLSFVFSHVFKFLSLLLSVLSERSTTVLEGLEMESLTSTDTKHAPKVADKKEAKELVKATPELKKEEVKADDKKEAVKETEKKEPPKATDKKEPPKESKVVMKVPICCGACADRVRLPLESVQGVRAVECDVPNKKVTAVVTTATPADVLRECVKIFKQSRMWRDDD